jgi:hypothetical protein
MTLQLTDSPINQVSPVFGGPRTAASAATRVGIWCPNPSSADLEGSEEWIDRWYERIDRMGAVTLSVR